MLFLWTRLQCTWFTSTPKRVRVHMHCSFCLLTQVHANSMTFIWHTFSKWTKLQIAVPSRKQQRQPVTIVAVTIFGLCDNEPTCFLQAHFGHATTTSGHKSSLSWRGSVNGDSNELFRVSKQKLQLSLWISLFLFFSFLEKFNLSQI